MKFWSRISRSDFISRSSVKLHGEFYGEPLRDGDPCQTVASPRSGEGGHTGSVSALLKQPNLITYTEVFSFFTGDSSRQHFSVDTHECARDAAGSNAASPDNHTQYFDSFGTDFCATRFLHQCYDSRSLEFVALCSYSLSSTTARLVAGPAHQRYPTYIFIIYPAHRCRLCVTNVVQSRSLWASPATCTGSASLRARHGRRH